MRDVSNDWKERKEKLKDNQVLLFGFLLESIICNNPSGANTVVSDIIFFLTTELKIGKWKVEILLDNRRPFIIESSSSNSFLNIASYIKLKGWLRIKIYNTGDLTVILERKDNVYAFQKVDTSDL